MSEKGFTPPHYEIHRATENPLIITVGGEVGLSRIVAITPAFDPPMDANKYLAGITLRYNVGIRPLHKVANDKGLIFEVSVKGEDQIAYQRLEDGIDALGTLANAWHSPEAALGLLYPQPKDYRRKPVTPAIRRLFERSLAELTSSRYIWGKSHAEELLNQPSESPIERLKALE